MTRPFTTVRYWTLIGVACMGLVSIRAQAPQRVAAPSRPYAVPRNALGQPDFEGVWTNNSITPLQRPAAWAGRAFLTDAEVAQLEKVSRKLEEAGDALFGDELLLFKRTDEPLLEYACHEGNVGLFGILSGARKQEADAARR